MGQLPTSLGTASAAASPRSFFLLKSPMGWMSAANAKRTAGWARSSQKNRESGGGRLGLRLGKTAGCRAVLGPALKFATGCHNAFNCGPSRKTANACTCHLSGVPCFPPPWGGEGWPQAAGVVQYSRRRTVAGHSRGAWGVLPAALAFISSLLHSY